MKTSCDVTQLDFTEHFTKISFSSLKSADISRFYSHYDINLYKWKIYLITFLTRGQTCFYYKKNESYEIFVTCCDKQILSLKWISALFVFNLLPLFIHFQPLQLFVLDEIRIFKKKGWYYPYQHRLIAFLRPVFKISRF